MRFSSTLLFISMMNDTDTSRSNNIRDCLHGGGGPQIGEVTHDVAGQLLLKTSRRG